MSNPTTADNLMDLEPISRPVPNGIVTLDQLRGLPEPLALGSRHRPVPHSLIVEAVIGELSRRELPAGAMKWELTKEGARLDGRLCLFKDDAKQAAQRQVLKESRAETYTGIDAEAVQALLPDHLKGGFGATLVVSHANDRSQALRLGTAVEVFICNNLAVDTTGGEIIRRKHTGDEPWDARLATMIERALQGFGRFNRRIDAMRNERLTDERAKAMIYDAFTMQYPPLAPHQFVEVGKTYFAHQTEDVGGTTRWDLHNAFTRCMRELPQRRQIEGGQRLTDLLSGDLLPIEVTEVEPN